MSTQPAGWHPDPIDERQWRWWDGEAWTDHVAPRDDVEAAVSQPDPTEPEIAAGSWPASAAASLEAAVGEDSTGPAATADDFDDVTIARLAVEPAVPEPESVVPVEPAPVPIDAVAAPESVDEDGAAPLVVGDSSQWFQGVGDDDATEPDGDSAADSATAADPPLIEVPPSASIDVPTTPMAQAPPAPTEIAPFVAPEVVPPEVAEAPAAPTPIEPEVAADEAGAPAVSADPAPHPFDAPVPAAEIAPSVAQVPVASGPPPLERSSEPPAESTAGRSFLTRRLLQVAAALVVVAVIVGSFVITRPDAANDGLGPFEATIDGDDALFVTEVRLGAGDALGVAVEPSDDSLDPVLGIGPADEATLAAHAEFEDDDLDLVASAALYDLQADAFDDGTGATAGNSLMFVVDEGQDGDSEQFGFVAPRAGVYAVSVAGFGDTEGDVDVVIDVQPATAPLDADADTADVNALIEGEHADFLAAFGDAAASPLERGMIRRHRYPSIAVQTVALADSLVAQNDVSEATARCIADATYAELGLKKMIAIDLASGGIPEDIPADLANEFLDVLDRATDGCTN